MKVSLLLFCITMTLICHACTTGNNSGAHTEWQSSRSIPKDSLPWIDFTWNGDSIDGRYFDKLCMNVPVRIEGLPGKTFCQFDLGSNITMLYGNPLKPYLNQGNSLSKKYKENRKWFFFHSWPYLKDLKIDMGKQSVIIPHAFIP